MVRVPVTVTPSGEGPFGHRDLLGTTRELVGDTQASSNEYSHAGYRTLTGRAYDEAAPGPREPWTDQWRYTRRGPPATVGFRCALPLASIPGRLRHR